MRLSILLVTYNCAKLATRAIQCVLSHTAELDFEIIAVDNASNDNTTAELRTVYPRIQLIENRTNVGFARACNQAIQLAKGEFIVLLNTDCFLQNDAFGEMVAFLERQSDVGIVGARLLNTDKSPQGSCRRFVTTTREVLATLPCLNKLPFQCFHRDVLDALGCPAPMLVDYVSGACLMFRRSTVEIVGGFDEQFFMYSEEEEFCFRARKAGIKTAFVPGAVAVHVGGASFGKDVCRRSTLIAGSRLKYYMKYHSFLRTVCFRASLCRLCYSGHALASRQLHFPQ